MLFPGILSHSGGALAGPPLESPPEVGGLIKAYKAGYVINTQSGAGEITPCDLGADFIKYLFKGNVSFPQPAAKRPSAKAQIFRNILYPDGLPW
jgi:hypothetical protein